MEIYFGVARMLFYTLELMSNLKDNSNVYCKLTLAVTVGWELTPPSSLKMISTSALNLNTDALLWPLMAIKVVVKPRSKPK